IESNRATNVAGALGLLRAAAGGTLVLDEIQDVPHAEQPKLLRALQDGTVQVVGFRDPRNYPKVDIQVIAVSSRDLAAEVAAGRFRDELHARLQRHVMRLPPLKGRRAHIVPMALRFLARWFAAERPGTRPVLHPALAELLCLYDWP